MTVLLGLCPGGSVTYLWSGESGALMGFWNDLGLTISLSAIGGLLAAALATIILGVLKPWDETKNGGPYRMSARVPPGTWGYRAE